jgi:hypothetical protein
VLVGGLPLAGAEACGSEAENAVGEEVEPAPDLVVNEPGGDSECGAAEEREGGPIPAGVMPCLPGP